MIWRSVLEKWLFLCLGWDQCTKSFFLLRGTSSILKTFLSGTSQKNTLYNILKVNQVKPPTRRDSIRPNTGKNYLKTIRPHTSKNYIFLNVILD